LDVASTMNPNLTGRQNAIVYCALNRVPHDAVEELLVKAREFAELGPFFEVPVKTYSSGMLARLSFALATCTKPDVLLIDEILSVGDEHFQRKSYFRMMKLIEHGSLVVVVSHNLAFIEQTCTRALLITGGRLVFDGRPSEVAGRYRRTVT
jgi:lipopolysaccharide transport system ATP-binding protein